MLKWTTTETQTYEFLWSSKQWNSVINGNTVSVRFIRAWFRLFSPFCLRVVPFILINCLNCIMRHVSSLSVHINMIFFSHFKVGRLFDRGFGKWVVIVSGSNLDHFFFNWIPISSAEHYWFKLITRSRFIIPQYRPLHLADCRDYVIQKIPATSLQ